MATTSLSSTAYAHTDALGFIITPSDSEGFYDAEIFYGSWHSSGLSAAEGDLLLTMADGTQIGTQTFELVDGFVSVSDGTVPDGLVAGENYFFPNTSTPEQGDLTGDSGGHSIYAFQSVTFTSLAPGEYLFGYTQGSSFTANWQPSDTAINNGSFTIGESGELEDVGGAEPSIPDIDTAVGQYTVDQLNDGDVTTVFDGGTLATTGDAALSTDFTITDAGGTIDTAGHNIAVTGTLSNEDGASGGMTVAGSGSLTLSGENTYAGATTIDNGATLALTGTGTVAASSGVTANGTFDISGTDAGASITTIDGSGKVTLGDKTLTLTNASGQFDGVMSGQGGLTVAGGDAALTAQQNYRGETEIQEGASLALKGDGDIRYSGGVTVDGTLDISNKTDAGEVWWLNGGGEIVMGDNDLRVVNGETFAGVISGDGALHVDGGQLTLEGVNTYTGETTIGEATGLALSGNGSIAASSGLAVEGFLSIEDTTDGATLQNLTGSGGVRFGEKTLTITQASGQFDGWTYGDGGLVIQGGAASFGGETHHKGQTDINAGASLALTGEGSIADSAAIKADGTFDIASADAGVAIKSLTGGGSVVLGDNDLTLTSATTSFGGVISGAGGLTISAGDAGLSGVNTYTGCTTVAENASLALIGNGSIVTSGCATIEGTLDISHTNEGAGLQTLAGNGRVSLGEKDLTFTGSDDSLFGGSISGTGALIQDGKGLLALTGENSFSGGLTINDGGVMAGADASLGSGTVTIGDAMLVASGDFASDNAFTLSDPNSVINTNGHLLELTGNIGGDGSLNKEGAGTLRLTGANSFTGLNVKGGTLEFDSNAALGTTDGIVSIADDTILRTLDSFDIDHTIFVDDTRYAAFDTAGHDVNVTSDLTGNGSLYKLGDGTLTLSGANSQVYVEVLGGNMVVMGENASGSADGTIVLRQDATYTAGTDLNISQSVLIMGSNAKVDTGVNNVSFTGGFAGSDCLHKFGTGKLSLMAEGSNDIGACVHEGSMSFNSVFGGNVWVDQGAVMEGSGGVIGDVEVSGILAPGNSPGRLVVSGSVTQLAGSTLSLDIDGLQPGTGAGFHDSLVLTGETSVYTAGGTIAPILRGITGDATNSFDPSIGDMFRVVEAEGGVEGSFEGLSQPVDGMPENARFDVVYLDNTILLTLTPESYGLFADGNAGAFGAALDRFRGAAGVRDDGAVGALLAGLSGLDAVELERVMQQAAGEIHADSMEAMFQTRRQIRSTVRDRMQAIAGRGEVAESLWAISSYDYTHYDGDRNASNFDADTLALTVGADAQIVPSVRAGAAFTFSETRSNTEQMGSAVADSYTLTAYGRYVTGKAYVDGLVSYGLDRYSTSRYVDLSTGTEQLRSSPDGDSLAFDVEAGRAIGLNGFTITPAVGLSHNEVARQDVREAGAEALALSFHDEQRASLQARVGARLAGQWIRETMTVRPTMSLFLSEELQDQATTVDPMLHGARFDVQSPSLGNYTLSLAGGFDVEVSKAVDVGFGVRLEESDRFSRQSANATFIWHW
ncbi:autotransporter domain-containing protein [Henriciella aquimarina]|uniref:autotransporter domain-containing protein n=1 Tax=Henriciella aquimarina TaxID=545261 RepID=UPI001301F384|nr:autotransporter domain-containing protein [Henriciella aquimarina]